MLLARAGQAGHVVSSCRPSSGVASVSPRCGSSLAWGARRGAPEIIGGTRPLAPSQLCTRSQAAGAPGSRLQAFSQDATPSTSNRGADTAETTGHGDLQALIGAIPFRKLAIWSFVGALAYQLSDFFGIMMGTFIISFIGNSFVESASQAGPLSFLGKAKSRKAMVILYFSLILAIVTMFGVLTIPDIAKEGVDFVNRLQSDNIWVVLVEKTRAGLGDNIMESIEKAIYLATHNDITAAAAGTQAWTAERSVALGMQVSGMLKGYTTTAAKITAQLLSSVTKFAVQIVVSLVLGFMLVWDMPSISSGMATLRNSRLAPFYNEVAPVLSVFGKLFGKALEAQARIALVNTALTAVGMWLLAIPGIGLLSLFVFICSFIPIAGCIISTIPIGFVALTEYGFFKLLLVILMVTLVHFVEAYMLNPAIYSAHLKLHPLMVLSVLVIAEHSLGIWGLLLAVPLTVFALDYCIRYPDSSVTEVGKKELSKVMQSGDEEEMRAQLALESGAGPAPGSGLGSSSSTGSTSSTSSTGSSPYSGQGGPGSPGQASGRTPPPPRS